jgi:hypothetical protein
LGAALENASSANSNNLSGFTIKDGHDLVIAAPGGKMLWLFTGQYEGAGACLNLDFHDFRIARMAEVVAGHPANPQIL